MLSVFCNECSIKESMISDDAKLQFVASVLPGVFSEGTKYACNEE